MAQVIIKDWSTEWLQNTVSQLEGKLNLWNQQAVQGIIIETNKFRPTHDNVIVMVIPSIAGLWSLLAQEQSIHLMSARSNR